MFSTLSRSRKKLGWPLDEIFNSQQMKALNIHFFSVTENSPSSSKWEYATKPANMILTGYISCSGKVVLPTKTTTRLGVDLDTTHFKVGMDKGKHKAKSLYLVPTSKEYETFRFEKGAKSYSLGLLYILRKSRVHFDKTRYEFIIKPFEYEGVTAFELELANVTRKNKPLDRKATSSQAM